MAPIGKLHGFAGNSRFRRALAVATLGGLDVETDANFTMKDGAWKTPEFLEKFPLGYLPAFEGADGLNLQESGAIAEYFASLAPNANLIPTDAKEAAEAKQWQCFADQEIFIKGSVCLGLLHGRLPYNKPVFEAVFAQLVGRLEVLNKVLADRTFIVGHRLSLADLFLATALASAFTSLVGKDIRAKIPNVVRYAETVIKNPKLAPVFDNGNTQFVDVQPAYQPPAKEKKEKAPKAEQPKKEKAPKKPKEKEVDEEEEEPLVPAEKAPDALAALAALPKSAFNLEEWKRQYSNLDTRGAGGSIEWFDANFDREGFSCWKIQFKYNEELTLPFMSANQIGGLFARWEASRKYLFASMLVLGKTNDSLIEGILILRGQDANPVIQTAPDWESYSVSRLDLSNADDKAYFDAALAWDLVVSGKECADGKVFK